MIRNQTSAAYTAQGRNKPPQGPEQNKMLGPSDQIVHTPTISNAVYLLLFAGSSSNNKSDKKKF